MQSFVHLVAEAISKYFYIAMLAKYINNGLQGVPGCLTGARRSNQLATLHSQSFFVIVARLMFFHC
jgi:hypothetical protein